MATKKKPADKPATSKSREFVVLETFVDRGGIKHIKGAAFPFSKYSAEDLKIYTTAENRIGRAVVKEK